MGIYDKLMDNIIVDILFQKSENITDCTMGYNQLYKKLNEKYKEIKGYEYKEIRRDKYNSHIKKLVEEGILERRETGKSDRSVNYCLTTKAKNDKLLQLLEFKSKKEQKHYLIDSSEIKRARLFLLLFFSFFDKKGNDLHSDEELTLFLSDNNLSIENLKVEKTIKFWSLKDKVTYYENIGGFRIHKHEKITKNENKSIFEFSHYSTLIPGFTLEELLNSEQLRNFGYTNDEIKEAFDTLRNKKYIEKIWTYKNEPRYGTNDQYFHELIVNLYLIQNAIISKMMKIWVCKRQIQNDEKKWILFFNGIKEFKEIMTKIKDYKLQYRKMKNKKEVQKEIAKEIIQLDKKITREFRSLKGTFSTEIEKYQFPFEKFIDILYPKLFHGY